MRNLNRRIPLNNSIDTIPFYNSPNIPNFFFWQLYLHKKFYYFFIIISLSPPLKQPTTTTKQNTHTLQTHIPKTHHYQSNHHAKHTPLPINHHHKICPSPPENDDLWWWRRNRPPEKTQQPIHASLPHPAIATTRSMPPPPNHNTQNLATHSPSNHPHTITHHRTHTRKIITQ